MPDEKPKKEKKPKVPKEPKEKRAKAESAVFDTLPRWSVGKKWTELSADIIKEKRKDPDWADAVEVHPSGTKARIIMTREMIKQNKEWNKLPHFMKRGWGENEIIDLWAVAGRDPQVECVGKGTCFIKANRGYYCVKHQKEIDDLMRGT